MKTLFLLVGVMALMVGCSTTDENMGATGPEFETVGGNRTQGPINPASRNSTGALDTGTGSTGMGVGTGLGGGSTGSGLP